MNQQRKVLITTTYNEMGIIIDTKAEEVAQPNLQPTCPPVNLQESKTWQFAKWVADEIFDENWEYNKDAFAELACRKLAKLGIVRAKGDEWELIDPHESEEV